MPTDISLDFSSAIASTVLDKDSEGTGFTSVQPNTANNAYDLGRIDLNTSASSLVLTASQGSNSANTLKNALQVPINASTRSFTISTRLIGPFTNLTTAVQQGGIFLGSDQDNYVKFVILNSSSGTGGLGLQFYQEQNGVGSSVGGGSGSQVKGLDWASINTLDLFLTGDPATGVVTAAYRVNSDTAAPTPLAQQFTSTPTTPPLFADETTARAGILAFTKDAPDTTVTFDNFGIQYSPNIRINFQPDTSVPAGYIKDIGDAYSDTRGFGWVREDSLSSATAATPLSIVPYTRQRNRTGIDPRLDTVVQMEYAGTPAAAWEYAVPNGTYSVFVSVGDQPRQADGVYDSINTINVEGVNAINGFQSSLTQEFQQATVQATVSDGKLTIDAIGGINTKLNFIEISSIPSDTTINWSTVAPSPVPRSESLGVNVDGKLYLFGGFVTSDKSKWGFGPSNRVDMYDPVTNAWTQLPNMPKRLTHTGTEVVGKDVYFAGGYVGNDSSTNFGAQIFGTEDVWKYNVDTQTWTAMPPLPEARASGNLAFLDGNLHYFGGEDFNRTMDVGDHWVLSLAGGTSWTPAASLPNPRTHMADVVLDDKIYAIGGQQGFDHDLVTQNSVHVWDPANPNTWTAVASLPQPLSHISHSAFVMGDRIIVAGGEVDHLKAVSDVVAYDPQSNSWTELTPLPEPRFSGVATNIDNQIFYTMGGSDLGRGFNSTTWKGVVS